MTTENIHATAIAMAGRAALIRGGSGAGKSDLALRCIGLGASPLLPGPAMLIADDQVVARQREGCVWLSAPHTIRGLIEVRGLGLVRVPVADSVPLALVVDLVAPELVERLPPDGEMACLCDMQVPRIALTPFEASAPFKLLIALAGAREPQ